ncbi:hypothetical protein D3C72_1706610 [compost metagenome]
MAQTGHEDPLVPLHLVLQVDARIALRGAWPVGQLGHRHIAYAVNRVVGIDGAVGRAFALVLALARVFRPHQQGVLHCTRAEMAFDMVVDGVHAGPCQRFVVVAPQLALARWVLLPAAGQREGVGVVVV